MEVRSERKKQAAQLVKERWHLPKDAEVEFHELKSNKPCEPDFLIVSGQWIECKHCHWGLQVGIDDELVDGHLYSNGRKVI